MTSVLLLVEVRTWRSSDTNVGRDGGDVNWRRGFVPVCLGLCYENGQADEQQCTKAK